MNTFLKRSFMPGRVLMICALALQATTLSAHAPALLRLHATGCTMSNETAIYFDSGGSFTYNSSTDAPSLGTNPGYVNIVSRFCNIDYQIKCLPSLTQNMSVPLKITTGISGVYQVSASDLQNMPSGACLVLFDQQTGSSQDLRFGNYMCTISDTESVARFTLTINIVIVPLTGNFMDPTCRSSGNGFVSAAQPAGAGPWNYYWKDSLNNILQVSLQKNSGDTMFGLNAGVYKVDVTLNGTCSNASAGFYLQGIQSPLAFFNANTDTVHPYDAVVFTNASNNAANYQWDLGDGTGSTDTDPAHFYSAPGSYTIGLAAWGSACADTAYYQKEIYVTLQTTGSTHLNATETAVILQKDPRGYSIKLGADISHGAVISVCDLLGRALISKEVSGATDQTIYLGYPQASVFVISVISGEGALLLKKMIIQ